MDEKVQEFEEKCADLVSENPDSPEAHEGGRCGNTSVPDKAFLSGTSAETQKKPQQRNSRWNATLTAQLTYKRHHPFEKLSGTFNIKQRRTIDKQNVESVHHMLVSQPPRDSNAPVHLAQFKHETDYKHCLERCFAFTFSYDGRHVDFR